MKNVFKGSASSCVGLIRKWTVRKDMKKARQVEYQKHQRKVRKETKDAEKFRNEIYALETKMLQTPCPTKTEDGPQSEPSTSEAVEAPKVEAKEEKEMNSNVDSGEASTKTTDETTGSENADEKTDSDDAGADQTKWPTEETKNAEGRFQ